VCVHSLIESCIESGLSGDPSRANAFRPGGRQTVFKAYLIIIVAVHLDLEVCPSS